LSIFLEPKKSCLESGGKTRIFQDSVCPVHGETHPPNSEECLLRGLGTKNFPLNLLSLFETTVLANYYLILGIPQHATDDDIKRAYRRLAMQYHPDRNKDPLAPQRFREIQTAYDVLLDPQQRHLYDNRLFNVFDPSSTPTHTNYYDPPIDPFTGRKNYKYHRGKPKKERDLNAPFDNFEVKYISEFDFEYVVLYRVILLGIPGFIASAFLSAQLFESYSFMHAGHVLVTLPFLLFHFFVLLDCILPSLPFYALLTKVAKYRASGWQELFTRATDFEVNSYDFHQIKGGEWYKDKMYVYNSPIDFREVQQFLIYKSPLFKMKFQVCGIVNKEVRNLSLNNLKKPILLVASSVQIIVLCVVLLMGMHEMSFVFLVLFGLQTAYVLFFVASSRLFHGESFRDMLKWLH
jgi:hypothetical protein